MQKVAEQRVSVLVCVYVSECVTVISGQSHRFIVFGAKFWAMTHVATLYACALHQFCLNYAATV